MDITALGEFVFDSLTVTVDSTPGSQSEHDSGVPAYSFNVTAMKGDLVYYFGLVRAL